MFLETLLWFWREACVAFMHELFLLASQLVNGGAAMLLSVVHQPGYRPKARSRVNDAARPKSLSPVLFTQSIITVLDSDGAAGAAGSGPPAAESTGARASDVAWVFAMLYSLRNRASLVLARARSLLNGLLSVMLPHSLWLLLSRSFAQKSAPAPAASVPPSSGRVPAMASAAVVTGVMEDVHLAAALAVDSVFDSLRRSVVELRSRGVIAASCNAASRLARLVVFVSRRLWGVMSSRWRGASIPPEAVQSRDIQFLVQASGYPFEQHTATTDDGYILVLDRIPRHNSKNVVLFVHGIVDCSFAWVGSGPLHALGYRAHDAGCDVWMVNLRGTRGCEHTKKQIPSREYWDFCVDHHALRDLPAAVEALRAVKERERADVTMFPSLPGVPRQRFPRSARLQLAQAQAEVNLTLIGHSMGGAASVMYVIGSRLRGRPHHVSKLILLSPAGFHTTVPQAARWLGPPAYLLARLMRPWVHALRFPSDHVRVFIQKLTQDVRGMAAVRDLVSVTVTGLLLGRGTAAEEFAFARLPQLTSNIFAGTSMGVFRQIFQWWWYGRFTAMDYGRRDNLRVHGQSEPVNYAQHYDKIDIPMHVVCGRRDLLITASDSMRHFEALRAVHPELAFSTVVKCGHVDFTYGMSDALVAYVARQLPRPSTRLRRALSVG